MVYGLVRFSYIYLSSPALVKALRVPVLTPLFPYVDRLFGSDVLPPFYFTYWILVIAIIAISHEFAHGIFARLNNIKVHSTGFGFLGPFLAAFVEPDEKQMQKSKIFPQLSILSAGTFANVVMMVLFGIIFWLFFAAAFTPAGVYFSTYSTTPLNLSSISFENNLTLNGLNLTLIKSDNKTYYAIPEVLEFTKENNLSYTYVYENTPAINLGIVGAITEVDGTKITSYDELSSAIYSHYPGDKIIIKTILENKTINSYDLELADKNGKAYIGIGVSPIESRGMMSWFYDILSKIKSPQVYYLSSMGDFGIFIYNLLWWIVVINLGVALTNMIPVGIFDGGRFFYLTILGITRSDKVAKIAYKISTWFILILIFALMIQWFYAIF